MENAGRVGSKIRFGVFELDPGSGELRKSGMRIRLQDQPFKVLCILLERPGEVVTRDELRSRIWPGDSFGDFDHAVNVAIAKLRQALGDSPGAPRFVETLPRRGYRFLASVLPAESVSTRDRYLPTSKRRLPLVIMLGVVMVLLTAAAGLVLRKWFSHATGPDFQGMSIKRLTQVGDVGSPVAISSDGSYVAYVRFNSSGKTSIPRLMQIATGTEMPIPEAEGPLILGLTFSPDGNYLYVMRNDQVDPITHRLFRIPTLGTHLEHLLDSVDTPVSFSPDGQKFVYTRDVPKLGAIELRIASADGGNDHLLAIINGTSEVYARGGAAWSPDGRTICVPVEYTHAEKRWIMEAVSVADGNLHKLFSSHSFIGRPVWQPDGKSLIVGIQDAAHLMQLWTVSFPEGELRRLTNGLTDYGYRPDATRDGKTVATVATMTQDSHLWSVSRSNPSKARLINSNPQISEFANSPDGRIFAIAFDGTPLVMNVDGSHPAAFTKTHDAYGIRVCGEFLVFLSMGATGDQLVRVNRDGSNPTRLATGALSSLDCSSDGNFVYYLDTTQPAKISRVAITGGTPAEVARILGQDTFGLISVSPDGRFLAYCYDEIVGQPVARLAVIPTSGGPPVKSFQRAVGLLRWSPDSKNLDYVDDPSGSCNIWEQPLTGESAKQLTNFTSASAECITSFDWSANGSDLLLLRAKSISDVTLISNFH
jgi:DNA-binding winged helix-turn-helix (wHTH) protein/Tol biopolymer transport system component